MKQPGHLHAAAVVVVAAAAAAVVRADCNGGKAVEEKGNWFCNQVTGITYTGLDRPGSYKEVVHMGKDGSCHLRDQSYSGPIAPFKDEVSVHVRGPVQLKTFSAYILTADGGSKLSRREEPEVRTLSRRHNHGHGHGHNHNHGHVHNRGLGHVHGHGPGLHVQRRGLDDASVHAHAHAHAHGHAHERRQLVTAVINGKVTSWMNNWFGPGTGTTPAAAPAAPVAAPAPVTLAPAPAPAAPVAPPGPATTSSPIAPPPPAHAAAPAPTSGYATTPPASAGSGTYKRVGYYEAASRKAEGITFLGNLGGQGSGVWCSTWGNSLSYINCNASAGSAHPTVLDDVLVGDGKEYSIWTDRSCDDGTCGFYRDGSVALHGFGGADKVFLFEFKMPRTGSSTLNGDMPAIWLLNAKIPRTAQYGTCSCWNNGGTGCGEFDIFEALASGDTKCKTTMHFTNSIGSSDWMARPVNDYIKVAAIFHSATATATVTILDKSFDMAETLTAKQVEQLVRGSNGRRSSMPVPH